MYIVTVFVLAIGLSMDALAAATLQGVALVKPRAVDVLRIALAFGVAQMLMPLIGWSLSEVLGDVIADVDHWVAFVLLAAIGGKMLYEGYTTNEPRAKAAGNMQLFLLALATSIDAAAAGLTFNMLQTSIMLTCVIIGTTTMVLSALGTLGGQYLGVQFGKKAEYVGGIILIALGFKILIQHLSA